VRLSVGTLTSSGPTATSTTFLTGRDCLMGFFLLDLGNLTSDGEQERLIPRSGKVEDLGSGLEISMYSLLRGLRDCAICCERDGGG